ncbi:uncharacterized protein [Rutidosis leptorrhynchoides]|uniref:uncharacterized protein n=1 Tax=Rutidosis leptorrhynchoides TaxID=125765 RepID=UPI003A9A171F
MDTRNKWVEKDRVKCNMLKQKSRLKWSIEGDENTRFFHSAIKRRNMKNNIRGLHINGLWQESPNEIKEEVFRFFKNQFEDRNPTMNGYSMLGFEITRISCEEAINLEKPFTEEEVWDAIKNCGSSKAPGPDGFNFKFYRKFRWLVKDTLMAAIHWFWDHYEISAVSVLVNGSPTKEFSLQRGIRQGDPFSPYLFIIASEGLNVFTNIAVRDGLIRGVQIGLDNTSISHLQFADDTIFFGHWGKRNISNVQKTLLCFEKVSGLKINMGKSCVIGVGVS